MLYIQNFITLPTSTSQNFVPNELNTSEGSNLFRLAYQYLSECEMRTPIRKMTRKGFPLSWNSSDILILALFY